MTKAKKYKTKIVGKIDSKFCKKNNINYYSDFKIKQSLGLIYHVKKHAHEFISVDSFNSTISKVNEIIKNPFFMYYDKMKNSIKYFKKIDEYVCVVVNLTSEEAFVSTIYPINKRSIEKLMDK